MIGMSLIEIVRGKQKMRKLTLSLPLTISVLKMYSSFWAGTYESYFRTRHFHVSFRNHTLKSFPLVFSIFLACTCHFRILLLVHFHRNFVALRLIVEKKFLFYVPKHISWQFDIRCVTLVELLNISLRIDASNKLVKLPTGSTCLFLKKEF